MQQHYTLTDIEALLFSGNKFTLPEHVSQLIKQLENELQVTEFPEVATIVKKPNEKNYEYGNGNGNDKKKHVYVKRNDNRQKEKEISAEDWETIRNFKSTKIDTKEGAEKDINHIRILFNKISPKNYDTQSVLILEAVQEFLSNPVSDETVHSANIDKLSKIVFDIVSTNKFFSELYADLYKLLMSKFELFTSILMNNIMNFKNTIDTIYYVDPNKDYDGYCNYTKINDNRKALTLFIINMYKKEALSKDKLIEILHYFLTKSIEYFNEPNKTNEVDEITENIFIIISNAQAKLSLEEEWKESLLPMIITISQMKIKDHVSLSNRVVFKYMDIIDSLE